jgi:hypothetical protein
MLVNIVGVPNVETLFAVEFFVAVFLVDVNELIEIT